MARQIIIVENALTSDGCLSGGAILWLTTPAALVPYAVTPATTVTSRVPDITPTEQAALNSGTVTEVFMEAGRFEVGVTDAEIQAEAAQWYAYKQHELNAKAPPKRYAGAYYDSVNGWINWPA